MSRQAVGLWDEIKSSGNLGVEPSSGACIYCRSKWQVKKCLKLPQTKAVLSFLGLSKPMGKKHQLHEALYRKLVQSTTTESSVTVTPSETTTSTITLSTPPSETTSEDEEEWTYKIGDRVQVYWPAEGRGHTLHKHIPRHTHTLSHIHVHTPHTFPPTHHILTHPDQWFVGDVSDINHTDSTFLIHYLDDDEEVWHPFDMEVRVNRTP